jgi:hypothetical protein
VRDNGYRDKQTYSVIYLETEADADAVHETVPGKRQGRDDPNLRMLVFGVFIFMGMVDENAFFKYMEDQKTCDQGDHRFGRIEIIRFYLIDYFRENVKAYYREKDARREGHKGMEFVLEPDGEQPAQKRGKKGRCGENNRHEMRHLL